MARRYRPDGTLTRGPEWATTPLLLLGALAFIVIGLMVLPQTVGQLSEVTQLRDGRGLTAQGTVVDAIKQKTSRRNGIGQPRTFQYCPLYRFETADGTIDHLEASTGCEPDPADVTGSVEIIYDPDDSSIAYVNTTTPMTGGLVMGGLSLVAGLGFIGVLIVVRVARSRTRALRRPPG